MWQQFGLLLITFSIISSATAQFSEFDEVDEDAEKLIEALSGTTVTLKCDVAPALTPPRSFIIEWFTNGTKIKADELGSATNRSRYIIDNVQASNAGLYVCRCAANNRMQKISLQIREDAFDEETISMESELHGPREGLTWAESGAVDLNLRIRAVDAATPYYQEFQKSGAVNTIIELRSWIANVTGETARLTKIVKNDIILMERDFDVLNLKNEDFIEYWTKKSRRATRMRTRLADSRVLLKAASFLGKLGGRSQVRGKWATKKPRQNVRAQREDDY